jgi:hypothetical protein
LIVKAALITGAAKRIAVLYDVMLPGLMARYRRYLQRTDTLMDAPSVRVIEGILLANERKIREAAKLRAELPSLRFGAEAELQRLAAREESVVELVLETDDAPQAA